MIKQLIEQLDQLAEALQSAKSIGVAELDRLNVLASTNDTVRELFGKFGFASRLSVGLDSQVRRAETSTHSKTGFSYEIRIGEERKPEIPKPNEPLAVTTATSGVIGDVNVIQEAFDGSQIINKVSVADSKSTTQAYGFVGNQFPERKPIQSLATSKTRSEVRSASGLIKDTVDHSEVVRIIRTSASKTKTTTAVNIYTPI